MLTQISNLKQVPLHDYDRVAFGQDHLDKEKQEIVQRVRSWYKPAPKREVVGDNSFAEKGTSFSSSSRSAYRLSGYWYCIRLVALNFELSEKSACK
jgi:hypothetical protein